MIALDIAGAFEEVGATVWLAGTIAEAMPLVERDDLSAAILDFGLGDGNADVLCGRLTDRVIPYMLHSGYSQHGLACRAGVVIPKPANPRVLISALCELLAINPRERLPADGLESIAGN